MAKIEQPTELAAMVNRADTLQKKLATLTGDTSDDFERACAKADLLIKRQTQGPSAVDDGKLRMSPTELQDLRSTQQKNAVLEFKQKQQERIVSRLTEQLKSATEPVKRVELTRKLQAANETLGETVRAKVEARTLSMNEIMELNQRLRREYNAAVKAGDTQKQAEIRQQQIELIKDRRSRGGIRL